MSPTTVDVPRKPYKAILGGILTLIGAVWANVQANGGNAPSGLWEWVSIIVPAVIVTGGVYQITNPPANPGVPGQPRHP